MEYKWSFREVLQNKSHGDYKRNEVMLIQGSYKKMNPPNPILDLEGKGVGV